MSAQQFKQLLEKTIERANQRDPKEVATLAHLLIYCLQNNYRYQLCSKNGNNAISGLIDELESEIKRCAIAPTSSPEDVLHHNYVLDEAVSNYEKFTNKHSQQQKLTDNILIWLLKGDFNDNFLRYCRQACQKRGVDMPFLMPEFSGIKISELGFGIFIDSEWPFTNQEVALFGRETEIDEHIGHLSLAIRQRRHYLLKGHQGVGKSLFIRFLIKIAIERWRGDLLLNNVRFILFEQKDFSFSEEENRARLTRLYQYLQANPQVIPIFDGFEVLLDRKFSVHEVFISLFGSILSTTGRTFVLVCRSEITLTSNYLESIKSYTLPPLSPEISLKIASLKIEELISTVGIPNNFESSKEEFCSLLIKIASERYPRRFFPEIAVHLVESTIHRATNRILHLKHPPLDKITNDDLWEHVAREQSLNTETLGKNPNEFYQTVQSNLKKQVIAQDAAVKKVCEVLQVMAKRPSRKAPRGRFLFVGPPGVGKTHLARQLAIHLGLGDEAFFIFNMSEYSSETARTRFMGADPGYVGYRSTKTIYDLVKSHPSCIILLDEIDRADASIQDILLSILEGEGKDAEGKTVYFSQAIFIMTTNQGQEQVEEIYNKTFSSNSTYRDELAKNFGDESLRKLILQGAIDETEIDMQKFLYAEINESKNRFKTSQIHSEFSLEREQEIVRYIELQNTYKCLEQVQKKTPLDRAFLDRIDFVIPFFPIKEPQYLKQVLNLTLEKYNWNNCPESTMNQIIDRALEEKESVRCLERIVMKYLIKTNQFYDN